MVTEEGNKEREKGREEREVGEKGLEDFRCRRNSGIKETQKDGGVS